MNCLQDSAQRQRVIEVIIYYGAAVNKLDAR